SFRDRSFSTSTNAFHHMLSLQHQRPLQTLNYAPARAHSRLRRIVGRATLVFFFLAALSFAIAWARRFVGQLQYLHWQQQCMSYAMPAERVVWDQRSNTRLRVPACLTQTAGTGPGSACIALHERRRPEGQSRIVIVEARPGDQPGWMSLE